VALGWKLGLNETAWLGAEVDGVDDGKEVEGEEEGEDEMLGRLVGMLVGSYDAASEVGISGTKKVVGYAVGCEVL